MISLFAAKEMVNRLFITASETQRALEALNPIKGAGPDRHFHKAPKILRAYKAPILSRILNISLVAPSLPQLQKHPAQHPNPT